MAENGKAGTGHLAEQPGQESNVRHEEVAKKPKADWRSEFATLVTAAPNLVPQILWFVLAVVALFVFARPALRLLEQNRISKVAIGIFEVDVAQDVAAHFKEGIGIPRTPSQFKPIADRARTIQDKLIGSVVLWVDDKNPSQNVQERHVLENFGITFDMAQSTEEAMKWMDRFHYDAVISNMSRPGEEANKTPCFSQGEPKGAGCAMAQLMHESYGDKMPPTIFYSSAYPQSAGTPPFSIGVTNRMDNLFGLVFDAVERRKTEEAAP